MHGLVYEYQVDSSGVARFEDTYRPDGQWAQFFRGAAGYLGTELLRDTARPGRYLVIDRWISAEAASRFVAECADEYARRSRQTAPLYLSELHIGAFDAVTAD